MARERTEFVTFRLSKAEQDMLQALMDAEGKTASQLLRALLHNAHAEHISRRRARPARFVKLKGAA